MQRFQSILLPVDFSDHCRLVAPAAAAMAKRFDAELVLLHALDLPPGAYTDWMAFLNLTDVSVFRRHGRQQLDYFRIPEFENIRVRRELADGAAARSIVDYAREAAVDLIMMPTRGLSPFRSLLMGSVTERVLHDTACPVWTEAHQQGEITPPTEYRSVLCAIDLSHSSTGVLRWGLRIAQEYGAKLHVVHVALEDWPEVRKQNLETYRRIASEAGVTSELGLLNPPIVGSVQDAVKRLGTDLLVIGRGHAAGTLGRLRTHAYQIIRGAGCPVLSV